ncbi:hypothetical protein QJQ45_009266 [Haematococcus lacustris]|nr:hypothetical protein QJQ45_009266 [Haematococcus lacustris]
MAQALHMLACIDLQAKALSTTVQSLGLDAQQEASVWSSAPRALLKLGKSGARPSHCNSLAALLSSHHLVKVQLNGPRSEVEAMAHTMAEQANAQLVGINGRHILFTKVGQTTEELLLEAKKELSKIEGYHAKKLAAREAVQEAKAEQAVPGSTGSAAKSRFSVSQASPSKPGSAARPSLSQPVRSLPAAAAPAWAPARANPVPLGSREGLQGGRRRQVQRPWQVDSGASAGAGREAGSRGGVSTAAPDLDTLIKRSLSKAPLNRKTLATEWDTLDKTLYEVELAEAESVARASRMAGMAKAQARKMKAQPKSRPQLAGKRDLEKRNNLACEGRAKVNIAPLRGILAPVTPCTLTVVHMNQQRRNDERDWRPLIAMAPRTKRSKKGSATMAARVAAGLAPWTRMAGFIANRLKTQHGTDTAASQQCEQELQAQIEELQAGLATAHTSNIVQQQQLVEQQQQLEVQQQQLEEQQQQLEEQQQHLEEQQQQVLAAASGAVCAAEQRAALATCNAHALTLQLGLLQHANAVMAGEAVALQQRAAEGDQAAAAIADLEARCQDLEAQCQDLVIECHEQQVECLRLSAAAPPSSPTAPSPCPASQDKRIRLVQNRGPSINVLRRLIADWESKPRTSQHRHNKDELATVQLCHTQVARYSTARYCVEYSLAALRLLVDCNLSFEKVQETIVQPTLLQPQFYHTLQQPHHHQQQPLQVQELGSSSSPYNNELGFEDDSVHSLS